MVVICVVMQYGLAHGYPHTSAYGVTTQKTAVDIFTAVKTSNLKWFVIASTSVAPSYVLVFFL
jgi:hypothetical protein